MEATDLAAMFDAMGDKIDADKLALFKSVIEANGIDSFRNYDEFYFAVLYPFQNFVDGYIMNEISENNDIRFILQNSQFVEGHFKTLIKRKEGWSCCADKSSTIMKRLVKFFETGEEIAFDYDGEYTYHLPEAVFTTHEEILEFYQGVHHLYYGDPDRYVKALAKVMEIPETGGA